MDEQMTSGTGAHAHVVGVKSWTAYLKVLALAVLVFCVALPLAFEHGDAGHITAAVVMVLGALLVAYKFLALRAVLLYYDDVGVWVSSGVLPWQRGVFGVKWRDMDEATFEQGFWSWLTRSYNVRIGHRFTKGSEIRLTRISNGKNAMALLNTRHHDMIRDGALE
ncbi:hypothetical protein KY495_09455 [Massilia sp. PAMC28688]|uniref:hypothetical protein n=1 Tax=Massilia sp. PAMC28688 TaxID=2861283 RepID=UPI001C62D514|nr:hypothetical protein [Massilia sp. PAMC28688]QYF95352.1 hypothetical protein KY495_09455 [Massilia sp. PAMC28688]